MANNYVATAVHQPQVVAQGDMHTQQSPEQMFDYACACLGFTRDQMLALRRFSATQLMQLQTCLPDVVACAPKLRDCIPALDNVAACAPQMGNLEAVVERCRTYEKLLKDACCPGQVLYGDVSTHHYSSKNTLYLKNVVQNFGANYVNAFPAPSGNTIRLEHEPRPGFVPELVEIHLSLANGGKNYLNIQVDFFVDLEHVGSEMLGSSFLDEDGRTKKVKFPSWRGKDGLIVGSAEKVAVELTVSGPNNLEFATIALHLNAAGWSQLCLAKDRPSCL
ncbi:MAG: hypothetical protein ACPG4T_07570 [Nannocystaceae bacterium]